MNSSFFQIRKYLSCQKEYFFIRNIYFYIVFLKIYEFYFLLFYKRVLFILLNWFFFTSLFFFFKNSVLIYKKRCLWKTSFFRTYQINYSFSVSSDSSSKSISHSLSINSSSDIWLSYSDPHIRLPIISSISSAFSGDSNT